MHFKKVLIIDDEIDLGQLLKNYFQRKNFEVHVSHSLNEGLLLINSISPDIVLIDNNFPEGSGWSTVPNLIQQYPTMRIALISAFNAPPPSIPHDKHFYIIEKPIRFADLDRYLDEIQAHSNN